MTQEAQEQIRAIMMRLVDIQQQQRRMIAKLTIQLHEVESLTGELKAMGAIKEEQGIA